MAKPGLVKTNLDTLTFRVNGLAMQTHNELKAGHAEKFYQRRLDAHAEWNLCTGI